jgi:hypothetical protein
VWPFAIHGSDTDVLTSYTFRHLCRQQVRTSYTHLRCQLLGAFQTLRQASISFIMFVSPSVCTHGTTRLPLDGFSLNLIFEHFFFENLLRKIQVSSKSGKNKGSFAWGPVYIFWSYLSQFFLDWKIFQVKVVENLETHILYSTIFFFRKSFHLWYNVEKYYRMGKAADGNMAHAHCMLRA